MLCIQGPTGSFGSRAPVRNDSVSLKHAVPPRGAGVTHPSLGWRRLKPSGFVVYRRPLRGGFLASRETGADSASSVKLLHGSEACQPCSVLAGVRIASLFTELWEACGATCSSGSIPWALSFPFHTTITPYPAGSPVSGRPPCSGPFQGSVLQGGHLHPILCARPVCISGLS